MRSFITIIAMMMIGTISSLGTAAATSNNTFWAYSCLPRQGATCVNYLSLLYENGTISSQPGDSFVGITDSTFDLLDTNAFYTAGQLAVSASQIDAMIYITDVRSRGKDQYIIQGFKQSNHGQVVSLTIDQADGTLYFIVQNGDDEPQYDLWSMNLNGFAPNFGLTKRFTMPWEYKHYAQPGLIKAANQPLLYSIGSTFPNRPQSVSQINIVTGKMKNATLGCDAWLYKSNTIDSFELDTSIDGNGTFLLYSATVNPPVLLRIKIEFDSSVSSCNLVYQFPRSIASSPFASRGASIVVGTDRSNPTSIYALLSDSIRGSNHGSGVTHNITSYRVDALRGQLVSSYALDMSNPLVQYLAGYQLYHIV